MHYKLQLPVGHKPWAISRACHAGTKLSHPLEKKTFSGEKQKAVDVQLLSCTDNGFLQKNRKPSLSPVGNGSQTGLLCIQELQKSLKPQDTLSPCLNAGEADLNCEGLKSRKSLYFSRCDFGFKSCKLFSPSKSHRFHVVFERFRRSRGDFTVCLNLISKQSHANLFWPFYNFFR